MTLGERIRQLRDERKMTLEQLAELSGVDVGTISALEIRKSQRSKYAAALAKGFGVDTDYLLGASAAAPARPLGPAREPTPLYSSDWPFRNLTSQ